jgi:hypothetical protein
MKKTSENLNAIYGTHKLNSYKACSRKHYYALCGEFFMLPLVIGVMM